MNILHKPPSETALTALSAMQTAVNKTLEKKRKLGQYAVFWKNGEMVIKYFGNSAELNVTNSEDGQS